MFASVSLSSFVISCIPATAMLLGSALALCLALPDKFQASLQNLSAGVILAAVAKELFPLMNHNGVIKDLGVALGFAIALCFMFGLQKLETVLEGPNPPENQQQQQQQQTRRASSTSPVDFTSFQVTPPRSRPTTSTSSTTTTSTSSTTTTTTTTNTNTTKTTITTTAASASASASSSSALAVSSTTVSTNASPTPEVLSEYPYYLDHHHEVTLEELDNPKLPVMVLDALNSGEMAPTTTTTTAATTASTTASAGEFYLDDEVSRELDRNQRVHLLEHLEGLQSAIVQTKDYLSSEKPVIGEVDQKYIHSLQKLTTHIHEDVHVLKLLPLSRGGSHRRSVSKLRPATEDMAAGVVPITLIVAVTIDAMVDGFLIGVAYSALPGAGYSMAFATCIEMCLLGITFSADLKPSMKHTYTHFVIVAVPPIALAFAGFLGGLIGTTLESVPFLFLAMIAFGVVALLFLVTQELLIDAHNKQEGREIWWINVWLFFGVLLGILVDFE